MFALVTFTMIGLVLYNIIIIYLGIGQGGVDTKSFNQMSILVMCGVNMGGYLFIILIHVFTHPKLVWRLFVDTFSYWFYQGAYSQTMVAHAFCNVDDVSWGTKGSTAQHGGKHYESDKVFFVSAWYFLCNLGSFGTQFWLIFAFMWI
jgi:cellulose synthase/poly-beta-1,6-N-acetylglucosamine synthase-like glycosyltransferase